MDEQVFEPIPGSSIEQAVHAMLDQANAVGVRVRAVFNGVPISAEPGGDTLVICAGWRAEMERRAEMRRQQGS